MCGIGNWISDEICQAAKVDPRGSLAGLWEAEATTATSASKPPAKKNHAKAAPATVPLVPGPVTRLRAATVAIVSQACQALGHTKRFGPHWLFHLRWEPIHVRRPDELAERLGVDLQVRFFAGSLHHTEQVV